MEVRKIFKYFIIVMLLLNIALLVWKYELYSIARSIGYVVILILLQL